MSDLKTSDLIETTRRHLQGTARNPVNLLDEQKLAATTTITLRYPLTGVQPGAVIEIGWVTYSVVDLDVTTRVLTVLPEVEGSAVDHPVETRVRMRPRHSVRRIIEALNADLMDLSTRGIYKLRSIASVDGVILVPADALVVLDAWSNESEPVHLPASRWKLSDTPSQTVLLGPNDIGYAVFGCTLGQFSYVTDVDVTTTGLVSTAEDLPPLGAAMRLIAGSESQRNLTDTQGDTRRAEEVPAGAVSGALRNLAVMR
ncbi:MAG: hypothetical protein ACRD0W_19855, partial [Acidimicrobiales bacterium]